MGLEELLKDIEKKAGKRVEDVISAAEEEGKKIIKEREAKAKEEKEETLKEEKEKGETEVEAAKTLARLEARKNLLKKKEEIISSILKKLKEKIGELPKSDYQRFFLETLHPLLSEGKYQLLVGRKDKEKLGEDFFHDVQKSISKGDLILAGETSEIDEGLLLKGDGVEINLSLENVLKSREREVKMKLNSFLFSK